MSRRLDCVDGECRVCNDLFKILTLLAAELEEDDNEFGEISL